MKKITLIVSLITICAGFSTFGQGYFQFSTGKSQVWDGFSTGVAHTASSVNVAFLWAASGAIPSVSNIQASVPTNATIFNQSWDPATAWTAILNDPNFHLAVNSGTGNSLASVLCTTTGAVSYNGGAAFAGPLATTPGGVYSLFMIGWSVFYATPQLAATANSAVGWSQAFQYTATSQTSIPNNMIARTPNFGVVGVPEPATLALAGLAGLSLLLFRRRK